MASLNKVLLIGNLTRAPELRYTPGGSAVCEFGLAMNRKFSGSNGQDREETCFVDIVVWGKQAENCNRFLEKGAPAFIEGRLNYDQWQDKESGAKRSRLRVIAERVQFLGRSGGGDNGDSGDDNYGGQQQYGGGNQQYGGGNQQYGNQSYGNQPQRQSYPQEQYRPQQPQSPQQQPQQPLQQNQPQTGRQQPPPPPMPEGSFNVDNAEDDIPF